MALAPDISLLGDKKLSRDLKRLESKLQRKIVKRAAKEAVKPVFEFAVQKAPVDEGRLRTAIEVKPLRAKAGAGYKVGHGKRAAHGIPESAKGFYPAHLELGTSRAAAQPHLRPALDVEPNAI